MKENINSMTYATDISTFIPSDVIALESRNAFLANLIITKIGFYDKAYKHSIYREGIAEYVMIYCVGGKGWVETGGRKIDIVQGEIIFCDKNLPHGYGADEVDPWSIHWVHFIGEGIPELFKILGVTSQSAVLSIGQKPELVSLVIEAYTILSTGYSFVNLFHSSTCFQEFLCEIVRLKMYSGLSGTKSIGIENVIKLMSKNIGSSCTLKQLADSMNMSKYHFVRIFKQKSGYTPIDYFNRLKIQRACELLDTTAYNIKEISDILSFSSPFYFSEVFKRITGYCPKSYKSLHKAIQYD
ncbi:MAG TPA: helix-turn-helix domain-containing protein [Ruminiclostridium sp.]